MTASLALTTRGLTKSYGPVRALWGVDLEVRPGEIFGFLGPNGSGKTTTIRCLLDLIRPSSGTVRVLGIDPQADPVAVRARVGYLPGERIVGLSKLARLVEHFSARPQVQERLTKQVAECLATRLRAPGVGVVLEAEHSCMTLRGVRAHGAKTVTSALLGTLRADPSSRAEFFALAGVPH